MENRAIDRSILARVSLALFDEAPVDRDEGRCTWFINNEPKREAAAQPSEGERMKTYLALFRGINVGGNSILPMKELRSILEKLGSENVRTYIQSGNAVFQHKAGSASLLANKISTAVQESHGFKPHVLLRESNDLEKAIAANPFPEAEKDPKSLHVYFLDASPKSPDLKTLESLKKDTERFSLKGNLFYLHAPDGVGRSKLAARVEKALGVAATARNWRTVCEIRDLAKQ